MKSRWVGGVQQSGTQAGRAWQTGGLLAGIALGSLALLLASGCNGESTSEATADREEPQQQASEATGQPAATSQTPSADASQITLEPANKEQLEAAIKAHAGKVVFVDFWATWCAPCKEQFPHTVELAHKFKDQGLAVISVSCDEDDGGAGALEFLRAQGADFQNFISTDGFNALDVLEIQGGALPHYRIYDRQGNLVKSFGPDPDTGLEPEDIEAEVKAALDQAS